MSTTLPAPSENQNYCHASALEGGVIEMPLNIILDGAPEGEFLKDVPSLAFLLRHSSSKHNFVFDLGIRSDLEGLPPAAEKRAKTLWNAKVPQDVVQSLIKGGLTPSDIAHICISHCHWDHIGNSALFPSSTFILGAGSKGLMDEGYPKNPDALFAHDIVPQERTKFVFDPKNGEEKTKWVSIGPFPKALDFYGDGSLYIIDAPGHVAGHINVLARTSNSGGWLYLAGDSAHHWCLLGGPAGHDMTKVSMATRLNDEGKVVGCMHMDKEAAEAHMRRIEQLKALGNVQVILAHDAPWFAENRGGDAFWPGTIKSL